MEKSMFSKKGEEIGVAFFQHNKIRQLFGKK